MRTKKGREEASLAASSSSSSSGAREEKKKKRDLAPEKKESDQTCHRVTHTAATSRITRWKPKRERRKFNLQTSPFLRGPSLYLLLHLWRYFLPLPYSLGFKAENYIYLNMRLLPFFKCQSRLAPFPPGLQACKQQGLFSSFLHLPTRVFLLFFFARMGTGF